MPTNITLMQEAIRAAKEAANAEKTDLQKYQALRVIRDAILAEMDILAMTMSKEE